MSTRSKKEYPFKVTTLIPKGCNIGSKKKHTIRYSYHKTLEGAISEVNTWMSAGLESFYKARN